MKRQLFTLIILICFHNIGYSQTEVSGNISGDTKWIKAHSPYLIKDDLKIFGGVTLEIESGVTVNSNSGKTIFAYGTLLCTGTANDSIFLNSCRINAEFDNRQSIKLNYCVVTNSNLFLYNDYCENTIIKNCRFYNNSTVIYNSIPYNQMYVDSCVFQNNGICIYYAGTSVTNSTFSGNEIGINYANDIDLIKNCEFINNSDVAIRIDNGNIENNLIINNNIGINTLLSNAIIKNNTIKHNNIGVQNNAIRLDFSNNQICNNNEFNFKHTYPGIIDIPNNCWCDSNIDAIKANNSDGVDIEPISTDCINETDVKELFAENIDINIYPTFVNNFLHFDSKNLKNGKFDIIDCIGKKVLFYELKSNNEIIDVSFLYNGIYFIVFHNYNRTFKFVKIN
jgi:hypothetical protein